MTRFLVALALLTTPALGETSFQTGRYICDRGVTVPVSYINAEDQAFAVINVDSNQITLLNEVSASGVRYGWPSDGASYVWWTKGAEASLYWKEAGNERLLLTCKEAS